MSAIALGALVLLRALAVAAVVARATQRRRPGRIAQYTPPPGVSLLEAGVLTRTERRAAAWPATACPARSAVRPRARRDKHRGRAAHGAQAAS